MYKIIKNKNKNAQSKETTGKYNDYKIFMQKEYLGDR